MLKNMNHILAVVSITMLAINLFFFPDSTEIIKNMILWATLYIVAEIRINKNSVSVTVTAEKKKKEDI